jgi:hypothetical protein
MKAKIAWASMICFLVFLVIIVESNSRSREEAPAKIAASQPEEECILPNPEWLFMRKRYREAREWLERENWASYPSAEPLKQTIDATIEATQLFEQGRLEEARAAIGRIPAPYDRAKPVVELRDKIAWELAKLLSAETPAPVVEEVVQP